MNIKILIIGSSRQNSAASQPPKDEVVMPFDTSNKYKNERGMIMEKWTWLLRQFGDRTSLERSGYGWKCTAELIKKTNARHQWNLVASNNIYLEK